MENLELFRQLGNRLRELEISDFHFKSIVGMNAYNQYVLENRIPALMKLSENSSSENIFYKFFLLGKETTASELQNLLGETIFVALLEHNFIEYFDVSDKNLDLDGNLQDSVYFSPKINISCYNLENNKDTVPIYVISDLKRISTNSNIDNEYVMSIGGASKSLAKMIIKDNAFRQYFDENIDNPTAVDIGCGSGIQALILAKLGYETYATDISEKALMYTNYNAVLNDVEITTICGSLFEPLENLDCKFDLIVSNPPFVITAEQVRKNNKYTYRDGGMKNDDLLMHFISNVSAFLKEKGIATFLGNWEERYDLPKFDDKHENKLLKAIPNNTDIWVIKRQEQTPEEYVKLWMDDAQSLKNSKEEYENKYCLWLEDFKNRNIENISFGYFILQKSKGTETVWKKIENGIQYLHQPTGEVVLKTLVAKENLFKIRKNSSRDIFDYKYLRPSHVTEERYYIPGQSDPHSIYMVQGGSLGRKKQLTSLEAAFIGACDGELTASQICEAIAYLLVTQNNNESDDSQFNADTEKENILNGIIEEIANFIETSLIEGFLEVI
ncbi:methyltransferase [Actinomyces sp. zg-332]|uniref:methyltransferase n=1 Tax=Actinomyces sp. zg-332 TaxID=2708340 RepID=UPI00141E0506|nr:methyltransferase [Actinomyces sp. zg-332]QPK94091.1 methyltransferase [Actinomyces sp. zg-332]